MKTGCELIQEERLRQWTEEGFNHLADDLHTEGQLAQAAACYLLDTEAKKPSTWPWSTSWWKPKSRIRNLVRAGALIAAEIDRLQRLQTKETTSG